MVTIEDPLTDPPPPEVPLSRAPLVRVIAQIVFPEVLSITKRDFVASFQEALRSSYPKLKHGQTQEIVFGPSGAISSKAESVWRFADNSNSWTISLASNFLAIETTSYTSRSDFLERFRVALVALQEHINPSEISRLGIRYIDRIEGDAMNDIRSLVREEVSGIAGLPAAESATIAVTESHFQLSEGTLICRWGQFAKNVTYDPSTIEPIDQLSWILDIDMSSTSPSELIVDEVVNRSESFAERIYTFFRWAVRDAFLVRYGGIIA
jgi:uncharacterized protein (TIGR04255 family)